MVLLNANTVISSKLFVLSYANPNFLTNFGLMLFLLPFILLIVHPLPLPRINLPSNYSTTNLQTTPIFEYLGVDAIYGFNPIPQINFILAPHPVFSLATPQTKKATYVMIQLLRIFTSRHVIFDESSIPPPTIFPILPPTEHSYLPLPPIFPSQHSPTLDSNTAHNSVTPVPTSKFPAIPFSSFIFYSHSLIYFFPLQINICFSTNLSTTNSPPNGHSATNRIS